MVFDHVSSKSVSCLSFVTFPFKCWASSRVWTPPAKTIITSYLTITWNLRQKNSQLGCDPLEAANFWCLGKLNLSYFGPRFYHLNSFFSVKTYHHNLVPTVELQNAAAENRVFHAGCQFAWCLPTRSESLGIKKNITTSHLLQARGRLFWEVRAW